MRIKISIFYRFFDLFGSILIPNLETFDFVHFFLAFSGFSKVSKISCDFPDGSLHLSN